MRKIIVSAALAATVLTGAAAYAGQDAPPPMRDPLTRADADKDGVVTQAEMLAEVDARFGKADANHDGKITPDERRAMFKDMRGRMAKPGMDREGGEPGPGPGPRKGGDGVVTIEQQRAQALKMFAFVDRNGDGRIDQAERSQLRDAMRAMRGPGGPGPHGPPPADAPEAPQGQ